MLQYLVILAFIEVFCQKIMGTECTSIIYCELSDTVAYYLRKVSETFCFGDFDVGRSVLTMLYFTSNKNISGVLQRNNVCENMTRIQGLGINISPKVLDSAIIEILLPHTIPPITR